MTDTAQVIVVMGVSGAGKSTIGTALAARMGCVFVEGDALHPAANVEKMRRGIPLTDQDRQPWLKALGKRLAEERRAGGAVVCACSALKRAYRDCLRTEAGTDILFVLLDLSADLLAERMAARKGHFMPASLLQSQMATLERPVSDERALIIPGDLPPDEIVQRIIRRTG